MLGLNMFHEAKLGDEEQKQQQWLRGLHALATWVKLKPAMTN